MLDSHAPLRIPALNWSALQERVRRTVEGAADPRPWVAAALDGDVRHVCAAMYLYDRRAVVDVPTDSAAQGIVWFVGDIHGDLLGLEAALAAIEYLGGPDDRIVFLGDLIDDGFHCVEVILRVVDLILERPGAVTVLAGNHDEALRYAHDRGSFASATEPGDFARWLNDHPTWHDVGRAFVRLVADLPRALFFPQGLFAAHAGFPHSDTWPQICAGGGPTTLEAPTMLSDFTWNRLAQSRRKIPNRASRGCEFGSQDFTGFCEVAARALHHPVRTFVRGHDHISDRLERFSRPRAEHRWAYDEAVLTINNMAFALPREARVDFANVGVTRWPALAMWPLEASVPLPSPVVVEIPPTVVEAYLRAYAPAAPPDVVVVQPFDPELPPEIDEPVAKGLAHGPL